MAGRNKGTGAKLVRAGALAAARPQIAIGVMAVFVLGLFFFAAMAFEFQDSTAANCSTSGTGPSEVPSDLYRIYVKAQGAYDVPWQYLAAINKVETNFGQSTLPGVHSGANFAGAAGPMQFGIGGAAGNTWGGAPRHLVQDHTGGYASDGDGDGWEDVYDPADAIIGAAKLLKANGAPSDMYKAILAYNHADWYVRKVQALAAQYVDEARTTQESANIDLNAGCASNSASVPGGADYVYPLAKQAVVIGCPFQGTHLKYQNWQSDNAVDLGTPIGTPVLAVADGVIGSRIGSLNSSASNLQGLRLTLETNGNDFFYQHLSQLSVLAGQHVTQGQVIGYSGISSVAHLHLGMHARFNPARAIGLAPVLCPDINWVWPPWLPLDATAENGSPLQAL